MCDTLCVVGRGRTLFAKNSDRPPDEPQVLEAHAARTRGARLRTQYLEIPDEGAYAVVGSRPTWLWGFEHGVNERCVAVGNERIWTVDDPRAAPPALIGMDLVRLALERAGSAEDALGILTGLLERHGQGGSCESGHDEPYFSSFLLADPGGAWIVETSASTWAARRVDDGASISNRVTLRDDWTVASRGISPGSDFDAWRDPEAPTGIADGRLAATRAAVATGASHLGPREIVATLRDHGAGPWGAPGSAPGRVDLPPVGVDEHWNGVTVCMHVRGISVTSASMVAELDADAPLRTWTCLGSPCASIYIPAFPPAIPVELADPASFARFALLRERVERSPEALEPVREALRGVEDELWAEADALHPAGDRRAYEQFAERAFAPVDAALTELGV